MATNFKTDPQTGKVVPMPVEDRSYLHTATAAVLVPLLQAFVTGVMIFAGVWLLGWRVFDLVDPEKPALVLTIIIMPIVWGWRLTAWGSLVARLEQMSGLDLNNNGRIDKPEVVRLKWSNTNDGRNGPSYESREADFPVSREQLITLAEGLLAGRPFAEKEWAGAGRPFSINDFRSIRNVMNRRGLIELVSEKDVRQGWRLSEEGWTVMENLIDIVKTDEGAG